MMRKPLLALSLAASMLAGLPSLAHAHDGRGRWYQYEEYHDDGDDDDDDDRPRYRRSYYEERDYHRPRYVEPRRYYRDERRHRCGGGSGTTGLLLGGVAGALLGRSVDRYGDRAPGTIIGAGAGALLGREVDRNSGC